MRKSLKRYSSVTLVLSALVFCSVAYAQDDASGNAAPAVPMVSGGVGQDEMDSLKSVEKQYDLKLMFTEANGVYLADLPVHIKDEKGKVIADTIAKGPILLVALPAGRYTVTASADYETKELKVTVTGKGLRSYQMRFSTRDTEKSGDTPSQ